MIFVYADALCKCVGPIMRATTTNNTHHKLNASMYVFVQIFIACVLPSAFVAL